MEILAVGLGVFMGSVLGIGLILFIDKINKK